MKVDQMVGYTSFLQHYSSYNIALGGDPSVRTNPQSQPKTEEDAQSKEAAVKTVEQENAPVAEVQKVPRGNASLENIQISLDSKKNALDAYSGNIAGQDMQSAINGMQKDDILQEYQYYVGDGEQTNGNVVYQGEEGTVIRL